MSWTLSTKAYLALVLGLLFVILSVVVVVLVNSTHETPRPHRRRTGLPHVARPQSRHPHLFLPGPEAQALRTSGPNTSKDYFEPVWMSSTYAVRKMDGYFRHFNQSPYYYKECAINARSPENEADDYEKAFLVDLQNNPQLTTKSAIRFLDGKPYFTFLRRGEAMEESCLRCHSSPEQAPGDLVDNMVLIAVSIGKLKMWLRPSPYEFPCQRHSQVRRSFSFTCPACCCWPWGVGSSLYGLGARDS